MTDFLIVGLSVGVFVLAWGCAEMALAGLRASLEKEGRYVGGLGRPAGADRRPAAWRRWLRRRQVRTDVVSGLGALARSYAPPRITQPQRDCDVARWKQISRS